MFGIDVQVLSFKQRSCVCLQFLLLMCVVMVSISVSRNSTTTSVDLLVIGTALCSGITVL